MQDNEKKQIADIVNAFRLVNQDIRKCFNIMSEKLEKNNNLEKWKKKEKGVKQPKDDYWDAETLFSGDNWYYLNWYGMYNQRVIGFTFVISIEYDEKEDMNYSDLIEKLDPNINKNTPMLCILGIYDPIDVNKIKLTDDENMQYIDDVLRFTDRWENYDSERIKYGLWLDVENHWEDVLNRRKEKDEGWYKKAKIKILHITDISSKEKAHQVIDDLINSTEKLYS